MNPIKEFQREVEINIQAQGKEAVLRKESKQWMELSCKSKYSYNFSALGRPIIQYPQDMVAVQELIWAVRPDLIIETGIAHGGSLILSAAMLAQLDYCDAVESGLTLDPKASKRRVVGIDIDIRDHNRAAIEAHPMAHKIDLIQGSSIDPDIVHQVHDIAQGYENVMVFLDSNHTHEHVLAELEAYAPLTSKGSYCVVFDTIVEDLSEGFYVERPWDKGDNPKTAVWAYLKALQTEQAVGQDGQVLMFEIDQSIEHKLLLTVAPDGYLKRL